MTKRNNRRAISTIIGSAIFLVLFVSGFTVFIFALEVTADRFSEQLSISLAEQIRGKESFTIHPSIDTSELFYIELFNTGSVPVNALTAYLVNQSTGVISEYNINFQDGHVAPNERRALLANYVPGVSRTLAATGAIYDVKVVSEVGTIAIQEMTVPLDPFEVDLFTIPKNLGTGQDVTIAMIVSNRGDNFITNVEPANTGTVMTTPSTAIQPPTLGPFPDPTPGITLQPEESVLFTWEQTVIGAVGTLVTYTNGVVGIDPASGDTVTSDTDTDTIEFVPQAVSLLQEVQLSFLISSPSGSTGHEPVFGVNIINPTDEDISVSRIIFNAAANIESNVKMFLRTGGCAGTEIEPNAAGASWSCPADGVLVWSAASGSGVTVPGRDTIAFMTQVDSGTIGAQSNDPATLITGTAFTSFGATSQLAGSTGVLADEGHVAAIFGVNSVTSSVVVTTDIVISTIEGNIRAHPSGDQLDLMFALASLDDADGILTGTFIINVPAGFTVNGQTVNPTDGCDVSAASTLTALGFTDGSTQITCTVTNVGTAGAEAVVITIDTTAPNATADALYIVVALAEGIGEGTPAQAIGPFLEFPIQVLAVP